MVSVPSRSKGCGTCRQRKVACTLEQPHCTRCVKAKRECTGYDRKRIFIIERGPKPMLDSTSEAAGPSNSGTQEKEISRRHEQQDSIRPIISLAQQAPTHSAHRQQLLSHFLYSYIPIDSWLRDTYHISDRGSIWYFLLPSLPDIPPALSYSVVALGAAYLGRLHADEALIQQGLLCYRRGLKALQRDLRDERAMYKDETLATCMALATFESVECPDGSNHGWASHTNGCTRLIKLRGPEAHTSGFGHRLFVSFRITDLMEDIVHLRPSYLSDAAWITIPWSSSPKTPIDKLVDITSELANVLPEEVTLDASEPNSLLAVGISLADRCWAVDASLRRFYADFEATNESPLYWSVPADHSAYNPEPHSASPTLFQFANRRTAYVCVLYWSTSILLWYILSHIYRTLHSISSASSAFDASTLPPLEPSLSIKTLTGNVCRAMPYFLQDSMQGFGPALAAIPLVTVIETLKDVPGCELEVLWARGAMRKLPSRGMRLMKA